MGTQRKIENWCKDERFLRYASRRMTEEITEVPENQQYDPQYEELDEAFDRDDRYVVPLAEYLAYRLHLAKLCKNARKRRRGIWQVFVQVAMLGCYTEVFAEVFDPLLAELHDTVMPMLHEEYVRKSNPKKK
ncbi:hypothetical protein ABHZ61_02290 [Bacteroides thetaiotaomicron]|uniref:hypothetical protein n=1 Tax=Bacteroides thetaiotaomicron TaxID=818 RepID=UPI0032602CA8